MQHKKNTCVGLFSKQDSIAVCQHVRFQLQYQTKLSTLGFGTSLIYAEHQAQVSKQVHKWGAAPWLRNKGSSESGTATRVQMRYGGTNYPDVVYSSLPWSRNNGTNEVWGVQIALVFVAWVQMRKRLSTLVLKHWYNLTWCCNKGTSEVGVQQADLPTREKRSTSVWLSAKSGLSWWCTLVRLSRKKTVCWNAESYCLNGRCTLLFACLFACREKSKVHWKN